MKFRSYEIVYRVDGRRRVFSHEGLGGFSCDDLELRLDFDGELLTARIATRARLCIERFRVLLSHDFRPSERCLLNGWQSWTETRWLARRERMHGLERVPRALVGHYVLDGSGDYRFCPYAARRGRFHGWTFSEIRRGQEHCLLASTDETHGFTLIEVDAPAGSAFAETEPPNRELAAGETVRLCSYALLHGTRSQVYDRWFELMGIRARPAPALVGYSSWYRHYGDIDEPGLAHDLAGARQVLGGLDLSGCVPVFQVDDGWAKVGDWLEPHKAKFPRGMGHLAGEIAAQRWKLPGFPYIFSRFAKKPSPDKPRNGTNNTQIPVFRVSAGAIFSQTLKKCTENPEVSSAGDEMPLVPGLWIAPFVCERDSRLFSEHPDWLLHDDAGAPVRTGSHWSGAYALDTLNPEVRSYVSEAIETAAREWGFSFLKLDFLYAACMLPHGGMNRGELMADAIELLREAAGEEVLLDGCGVPLASAFGKLDYCRIGCDVGLDWDGLAPMRLLERERVSTKHSLACTLSRSPLDGRAFGCDPDVVFLRAGVRLSPGQQQRLLDADASCGSMLLTSDDMGAWDAKARQRFQRAVRLLAERGKPA